VIRPPTDEHPHPAAALEQWEFGWAASSEAGLVRCTFGPGVAAFLVDLDLGGDRLIVADEAVPRPRTGLDLRTDGLWASLYCETPYEHWTLGLEAFGLRLDEPPPDGVRWSDLLGERLAVGFDLEWETTGEPVGLPDGDGYRQPGRITGEVLVVRDRIVVAATGWREHWWTLPAG